MSPATRIPLVGAIALSLVALAMPISADGHNLQEFEGSGFFDWESGSPSGHMMFRDVVTQFTVTVTDGEHVRITMQSALGAADCSFVDGGSTSGWIEMIDYGRADCTSASAGIDDTVDPCRAVASVTGFDGLYRMKASGSGSGSCTSY